MSQGHQSNAGEHGFTLVEMVITVTLLGILFMALSSVLASGLKILAVQKARTQGNAVATLGIEDLQRYGYGVLSTCWRPAGSQVPTAFSLPSDLSTIVQSKNSGCPAVTSTSTVASQEAAANYGDDPCATPAATPAGVARAYYQCVKFGGNVTYNVRRYVSFTGNDQLAKRIAVYVNWNDSIGVHEVSQQSSLRSPASGDVVGVDPPSFISGTTVTTGHTYTINPDGTLQSPAAVNFTAKVNGLSSTTNDRVFVSYLTTDGVDVQTASVELTYQSVSAGTATYAGSVPAGTKLAVGTQYFTFNAARAADGKVGALVDTPTTSVCPAAGCPVGPSFVLTAGQVAQATNPVAVSIDDGGALKSDVAVSAKTVNLAATDSLSLVVPTRNGVVVLGMRQTGCSSNECTWVATLSTTAGYKLGAGDFQVYFTASQDTSTYTASAASTPFRATVS